MRPSRNPRNTIALLLFVIVILGAALAVMILAFFMIRPAAAPASGQDASTLLVDGDLVMARAAEFGVSTEFLQLILPGYLVYRDGGTYVYQPINYDLPQSGYDWSNLSYAGDRIYYQDEAFPEVSYGVDVSLYQGQIDWQAVAADGVDFAMIRVGYRGYSEGSLFVDAYAAQNLAGACAAGLEIGAYFFSQAVNEAEAEEEAQLTLDVIRDYPLAYPVVCDMEEISGAAARTDALTVAQRTAVIKAFCRKIEEAGYPAMVYGNIKWLAGRVDLKELADYPLWLGQYYTRPLFPYDFAIWQYTNSAAVEGIPTDVDMNICFKKSWQD